MNNGEQQPVEQMAVEAGIDWRVYAECAYGDPELFFPIGDTLAARKQTEDAKEVCRTCHVSDTCLEWALERDEAGIWGGTTEDERRRLRRRATRAI